MSPHLYVLVLPSSKQPSHIGIPYPSIMLGALHIYVEDCMDLELYMGVLSTITKSLARVVQRLSFLMIALNMRDILDFETMA